MDAGQYRELVEIPQERLDAEYKSWMDLNGNEARAKVAKHLCALANGGGGFLVFGFDDDMSPSLAAYRPDRMARTTKIVSLRS